MSEIQISPIELQEAAEEFRQASMDSQALMDRLDTTMDGIERKWSGSAQQVFYQSYAQWRVHFSGLAMLLGDISQELEALAERFLREDR